MLANAKSNDAIAILVSFKKKEVIDITKKIKDKNKYILILPNASLFFLMPIIVSQPQRFSYL